MNELSQEEIAKKWESVARELLEKRGDKYRITEKGEDNFNRGIESLRTCLKILDKCK